MNKTGTFQFEAVDETRNVTGTYKYDDAWFGEDANVLSPELRMLSMCFSLASFPNPETKDRTYSNAEAFLAELGFTDVEVNKDFKRTPEEFTIGIVAARKDVTLSGEECTIYTIGFRGASYGREWYGNTIIEENGVPRGFRAALLKTVEFFRDYVYRHAAQEKKRKKVWIAGFSRAGAIAGLAGAALTRQPKRWGFSRKDIFVYTFESPRCIPKEMKVDYPNIHNTISKVDMVPLIAPASWGFIRPGVDDTILPSPGQKEWQDRAEEVRAILKGINPDIVCEEEGFVPLAIAGTQLKPVKDKEDYHRARGKLDAWWYSADLGDYFPHMITYMGSKLAKSVGKPELTDREAYAKYYEKSFGLVAKKYLGNDADQHEMVRGVLEKMINRGSAPFIRAIMYLILKRGRNRVLRRTASRITSLIIFRILTNKGFRGSAQELTHMRASIENMTYYFLFCASCDVQENDCAYIGTLGANIERIRGAHAPELIYAWLVV